MQEASLELDRGEYIGIFATQPCGRRLVHVNVYVWLREDDKLSVSVNMGTGEPDILQADIVEGRVTIRRADCVEKTKEE